MLECAERQLASVKDLLKTPTPENFEEVGQQLTALLSALQTFLSASSTKELQNPQNTSFLRRLPSELAHIRVLLQAPVSFLEGLAVFRIQKFGSYNCQGEMRGLGQENSARTITHL